MDALTASRRFRRAFLAALVGVVFTGFALADASLRFEASSLEIPARRSGLLWRRFDSDALVDLLIGGDGAFRLYLQRPGAGFAEIVPIVDLPASGGLFDAADLDGDGALELVLMHAGGVDAYAWNSAGRQMERRSPPLLQRAGGLAFPHWLASDFIFDFDGDGDEDLLYLADGKTQLYFRQGDAFTPIPPILSRPARMRIDIPDRRLDEHLRAELALPRPEFVDLNADGALDLRVQQRDRVDFFVQTPGGGIPERPSYGVDLGRFREASGGPRPGSLGGPGFQFLPRDIDGDRREDYVIASGNRLWVFRAGPGGVDFSRPNQMLKVSTTSMSVALLPLRDPERPDLVIFKYEMPSLGRIIAGLAIGLRFELEALAYRNDPPGAFSRVPDKRSLMVFKVPPLLKLMAELEDIRRQLRDLGQQTQRTAQGDLTGDGRADFVRLSGSTLEIFTAREALGASASAANLEGEFLRKALFAEKRREVTFQTILAFATDLATSLQEAAIAGQAPSARLSVDPPPGPVESLSCRDLNGDGREDVVLMLEPDPPAPGGDPEEPPQLLRFWISVPPGV